jgi:phosphatidate cytidylyltransferase
MAIAIYEYIHAYKSTDHKAIGSILLIGYIINAVIIFTDASTFLLPTIYIIAMLSMAAPIFVKGYNSVSSAITIVGYIYIVSFFSMLSYIRDKEAGIMLVLLVFIVAWFADTSAYYIGRHFGKRKLCPEVSPKKTIAGFIGGILGSILGVFLWDIILMGMSSPWYQIAAFGLIAGIISQIGDLVASLIKRNIGLKDYGKLIPGHGGILDRFDSILFVTPIVYYYIALFIG